MSNKPNDLQKLTEALRRCRYKEPTISEQSIHLPLIGSHVVYLFPGTRVFVPEHPQYGIPSPVVYYDPSRGKVCYKIEGSSRDFLGYQCVTTTVSRFLRYDIKSQCEGVSNAFPANSSARNDILKRGLRYLRHLAR